MTSLWGAYRADCTTSRGVEGRTSFHRADDQQMKRLIASVLDLIGYPFALISGLVLKGVRRVGLRNLPLIRRLLLSLGLMPVRDHYYEPFFDPRGFRHPPSRPRPIAGIDWNEDGQLRLLDEFVFADEVTGWGRSSSDPTEYSLDNPTFLSGDAEFWYQLIRARKPRRIIEIGSGNSTLIARKALAANALEDPEFKCDHVCVEPFEMPWLERVGVKVVRSRVEDLEYSFFDVLGGGDVLFIDSTHVIRPEGDVLFEYLELLPRLRPGVIVHVHDIFSPRNYLTEWLTEDVQFWNEQYLLEAFLAFNSEFEVLAAVNKLRHDHYGRLLEVCPHLTPDREPGSFYMRRVVPAAPEILPE
jgi:methyltransferase family protein